MTATNSNFLQRVTQSAWVRPVLFLVLLVVLWDVAIRIFRIPPYQIPKPADVLLTLWTDGPQLLTQAVPTTIATVQGFLLSAIFGIGIAVLIAGSRTIESYIYPLLVFSQSIPKIAIAPLFVVWFGFGMMPKVLTLRGHCEAVQMRARESHGVVWRATCATTLSALCGLATAYSGYLLRRPSRSPTDPTGPRS
jgi:ABC-type nitrate/sulfonate/bicarbonate transport system permease component